MKALVFGSLNIDQVYGVPHFVQPGETISSESLQSFTGGKGLNQSIALARSGVPVWHAGAVGKEDGGRLLLALEEAGVHTELIRRKDIPSGHAIIQNTPDGSNSIILYGGANQAITREDVEEVFSHFEEGDCLVVQNEINEMPLILETGRKKGMKVIMNPSPMDKKIESFPLTCVDFLILNEVEGSQMTGMPAEDGQKVLDALISIFPGTQIVLTLGEAGSIYGFGRERIHQDIYPVKAVDTTAAGDTFMGFFVGSLLQGKTAKEALDTASLASAIAVSRKGASPSIPTAAEVEERRRQLQEQA